MYAPKPDPDNMMYMYLLATFLIIGLGGWMTIDIMTHDYHHIERVSFYICLVFYTLFFSPYILQYFLRK